MTSLNRMLFRFFSFFPFYKLMFVSPTSSSYLYKQKPFGLNLRQGGRSWDASFYLSILWVRWVGVWTTQTESNSFLKLELCYELVNCGLLSSGERYFKICTILGNWLGFWQIQILCLKLGWVSIHCYFYKQESRNWLENRNIWVG